MDKSNNAKKTHATNRDTSMTAEEEQDQDLGDFPFHLDFGDDDDASAALELCSLCLRKRSALTHRPCCHVRVCPSCLTTYLESKVRQGVVFIQCPASACNSAFKDYEVSSALSQGMRHKFHKLLFEAKSDPVLKTCPRCGRERTVRETEQQTLTQKAARLKGYPVRCRACGLKWCTVCRAPWHEGLTCLKSVVDDRKVRGWGRTLRGAGEEGSERGNALPCPSCQTSIQRAEGCHSLACTSCGYRLCYNCGFMRQGIPKQGAEPCPPLQGDQKTKCSPLGCSASLWPRSPFCRGLMRGVVLVGTGLGTLLMPLLKLLLFLTLLLLTTGPAVLCGKLYPKVRPYLRRFSTKLQDFFDTVTSVLGFGRTVLIGVSVLAVLSAVVACPIVWCIRSVCLCLLF